MSTTLTNGLKLPDKGSVDWYADMQSNYAILDGAVGTVAEHSTQIAGKAPVVHTHTKADITDFPVYGNTAGTICEGNDSRLSDARTPVAHTHVTADVTDLLSGNHTWTGNQTYSGLTKTSGKQEQAAATNDDLDDYILNMETYNWGTSHINTPESFGSLLVLNREGNTHSSSYNGWLNQIGFGTTGKLYHRYKVNVAGSWSVWRKIYTDWDNYIPGQNNTYDLGSSSYQWNNVYSKNYYYNGIAWGLDKVNEWSNTNYFNKTLFCDFSSLANKAIPDAYTQASLIIVEGNTLPKTWHGGIALERYTNGDEGFQFLTCSYVNGTTQQLGALRYLVSGDGTESYCYSRGPTKQHLGTSTNKWTTLNGVNPGALSLPTTDPTKWVDLSGSISAAPTKYTYTPAVDGWISVMIKRSGGDCAVYLIQGNISNACYNKDSPLVGESNTFASACIPVRAGVSADIHIKGSGTTIESAYFMPCQGNV